MPPAIERDRGQPAAEHRLHLTASAARLRRPLPPDRLRPPPLPAASAGRSCMGAPPIASHAMGGAPIQSSREDRVTQVAYVTAGAAAEAQAVSRGLSGGIRRHPAATPPPSSR